MKKELQISLNGQCQSVQVEWKKMKSIRLRVYPSGEIRLSVPERLSLADINAFLAGRSRWICENLEKSQKSRPERPEPQITGWAGMTLPFLGEKLTISVTEATRNSVLREENRLCLFCTSPNDPATLHALLDSWQHSEAVAIFTESLWRMNRLTPNIPMPIFTARKMKTRWGSCSVHRGTIRLNQALIGVPIRYIDYVVLHELSHFVHPNHSKLFYAFVEARMPDWQERKKYLDAIPPIIKDSLPFY